MNDDQKAAAYYRIAAIQKEQARVPIPPYVPCRVRISRFVCGDGPFAHVRVGPGEYDCECNK